MLSLSEDYRFEVVEAFNSTSRYLDDILNINNNFFDSMVNPVWQHTFVSLSAFSRKQLSVTGDSMCTKYWLTAKEV